jgi:hypothetical protein
VLSTIGQFLFLFFIYPPIHSHPYSTTASVPPQLSIDLKISILIMTQSLDVESNKIVPVLPDSSSPFATVVVLRLNEASLILHVLWKVLHSVSNPLVKGYNNLTINELTSFELCSLYQNMSS